MGMPGDNSLAPACEIWRAWQCVGASCQIWRSARRIAEIRDLEERAFLDVVKQAFDEQAEVGRRARVGCPWQGSQWSAKTWSKLRR
eukprot:5938186-Pyramimonas_sp.AAC.1